MSENETKLKARLIKEKTSRFNELASELKLSEEELADFDVKSEEGLDAGIQTLRIMKGRKNAWEEAVPTKEKAFFHPADKRYGNAAERKPLKENGENGAAEPRPRRFNMEQLSDGRLEPDMDSDLESAESTVLRVYSYTDLEGSKRFNAAGFKI